MKHRTLTALRTMSSRPASRGRSSKVFPETEGLRRRISAQEGAEVVLEPFVPSCSAAQRAALDERVRHEGWASTRALLLFFIRFMTPVAILTIISFVIFAFMAYAIPNWFCHDAARASTVRRAAACRRCLPPQLPLPSPTAAASQAPFIAAGLAIRSQ